MCDIVVFCKRRRGNEFRLSVVGWGMCKRGRGKGKGERVPDPDRWSGKCVVNGS